MIRYNPKDWLRLIFLISTADTVRTLTPALLGMGVYTFLFVWLDIHFWPEKTFLNTTSIHSMLGIVISLLLVFRTNSAYDRWWEGRKHWGALTNASRNMAIQFDAMLPRAASDTRAQLRHLLAVFPAVLRDHLRQALPQDAATPNQIAHSIVRQAVQAKDGGHLSEEQLLSLMPNLTSLLDVTGACERIRNTPIPYSYNIFIKKFIFIFCVTLPFAFIQPFYYASIPLTMFIFYALASLELIAEEIEDPFGNDANDLPLDDIATRIRENVYELLAA